MGTFLALLGVRLGRALVSCGLGSAGGGGPAPAPTGRPCAHAGDAVRPLAAFPSPARRPLSAAPLAAQRTLVATPGPAEAC